jgi:ankyrin repeat protein
MLISVACGGANEVLDTPTPLSTATYTLVPPTDTPTVEPSTRQIPAASVNTPTVIPVPTSNSVSSKTPTINIFDAIAKESIADVKQHMSARINLNDSFIPIGVPWAGAAALHLAIVIGNEEIVQLLLDNGANIDIRAKDQPGGTPLQWAAFWAKRGLVELLVNAGANINTKDNNGCTPLCAATIPNLFVEEYENFKNSRASIRTFLISRGGKTEGALSGDTQGSAGSSQGSQGTRTSGGSGSAFIEEAPKLQNLLVKNLGPYDSASATFGDIRYKANFGKLVLDVFGYIHNKGQPNQYDNPTFEFKAPADTVVIVPVSGKIFSITWQETGSYPQEDWDILIRSSQHSEWAINVDHIVSIDCDRSGKAPVTCNKPLRIGGQVVTEGMSVEAGQVLGYVGNWPDYNDVGINGRTELTIMQYLFKEGSTPGPDTFIGVMNYCPTMHLAKEVESDMKATITELMQSYENWTGDTSIYEQEKMVAPGCLYTAIKEFKGKTEPVTE